MAGATLPLVLTTFVLTVTLGWVLNQWFALRTRQNQTATDLEHTQNHLRTCSEIRAGLEVNAASLRRELDRVRPSTVRRFVILA